MANEAPERIWAKLDRATVCMNGSSPLVASTREFSGYVEYIRADLATLFSEQARDALTELDQLRDRVKELEKALEWALTNADTEHPHYPSRNSYGKWSFPYLVSGTPSGGGVGEAWFDTALEAVQDAARRVREGGKV